MKVVVLASGSHGNVTYIETKKQKILLDFGMNLSYVKRKLKEINRDIKDVNYIIISHTHSDHVEGLGTLIKKYKPIICVTKTMFMELPNINDYEHILIYEDEITLDGVLIESIKTSHDTGDSRGFIISEKDESVVYLTDTGYLHQKHWYKLSNKNYYLFESNHDILKLKHGPYPKWLQRRILSDSGHLSNEAASIYLTRLIGDKTKKIVLMHLSQNNNSEELALSKINEVFKNSDIKFNDIECAHQDEILEVH